MPAHPSRKGFSLLELIFVIVILGIVASIGSELIARVYQQYIVQRAQLRASLKTELAAVQIANRLAAAIPGTVVKRNALSAGVIEDINADLSLPGDSYIALQWVGADMDSFNTNNNSVNPKVGWSGFCDLDKSLITTGTDILTPGSDLSLARTIIDNLSGSVNRIASASIYFPARFSSVPIEYGVDSVSGSTITLDAAPSSIIREHYKLAWSSYALVVTGGDLYLHYNFSPTRGVNIGNTRSLLMKNISTFKFKGEGRTIRFKICKEEEIGEDFNITACKEKAVF